MASSKPSATQDIPSPDEINRVTNYLQDQAGAAKEALIAAKQAQAEIAKSAADALVAENDVVGVVISRRSWTDQNIPWQKRGDITTIRLDFADGQQAIVSVGQDGDALDLQIVPAG
jgi:aconitase B